MTSLLIYLHCRLLMPLKMRLVSELNWALYKKLIAGWHVELMSWMPENCINFTESCPADYARGIFNYTADAQHVVIRQLNRLKTWTHSNIHFMFNHFEMFVNVLLCKNVLSSDWNIKTVNLDRLMLAECFGREAGEGPEQISKHFCVRFATTDQWNGRAGPTKV